jgi:hypothetical protein
MSWTVDSTAPSLSVISPANNTVTRNGTMTVTLNASEPLAVLLVLQPGDIEWTNIDATAGELILRAHGEGKQQAALKGEYTNAGW